MLDELAGVGFVCAPDIESAFALPHAHLALLLFVVPPIVALLVEPPLLLLADRHPRKPFVVGGLILFGAAQILAGLASDPWVLLVALSLAYPASGVGVNVTQACLMDAWPDERERSMARWTLMGALGDLATPALVGVLALIGLGWRDGFVVTGLALVAGAGVLALVPLPAPGRTDPDDEPTPSLRSALREAMAAPRLLPWLFAVTLCSLLDEVLVAFAALHLEHLGADPGERSLALMVFVAGEVAGLALVERALRHGEPLPLLKLAAGATAAAYAAWLLATSAAASFVLLPLVGLFAAPLYPIAMAQAYRALPHRSGAVNALSALFQPLEIALPLVLGAVADRAGLVAALALLGAAPVGLLALCYKHDRGHR